MSKGNGADQDNLVAQGFARLDPHLIEPRPPKIAWGKKYLAKTPEEKIAYLEKLAAAMNHAADLVQQERNALGAMLEIKEKQIRQLGKAMDNNSKMLQSEVTKMNEQRQGFHKEVNRLNTRIRELERGNLA